MKRKIYDSWLNWRNQNWKGIPWSWWIALVLLLAITAQVSFRSDWEQWWQHMKTATSSGKSLKWLFVAIVLMPINWLLETAKWQIFMRSFWRPTWKQAIKAVLAGVTVSLATPNRIGEYGGRMLIIPPQYAGGVILSTLAGSISQWIVFVVFGWPSAVYMLSWRFVWMENYLIPLALLGPLGIALVVSLWTAFNHKLWTWEFNSTWWRWLRRKLIKIRKITALQYLQGTILGGVRFFVFVTQYYCLLLFFGFEMHWAIGVAGICSIFFIQAALPLPPGIGVLTRTELAFLIWGSLITQPFAIVAATITLFIVNLLVPALLGIWLIVRMNRRAL